MKYTKKDLNRMILANSVAAFGGSLTWTGLPAFMVEHSGKVEMFSSLFMVSTLAGILFTFFGGSLADNFSRKTINQVCSSLSAACLVVLFFTLDQFGEMAFYIVCALTSILGALQSSALSAWASDVIEEVDLPNSQLLAQKNTYTMIAKLLGMGLGPIIYVYLKKYALLIDAATTLLEVGLLLGVTCLLKLNQPKKKSFSLKSYFSVFNKELSVLLVVFSLTAILTLPVLNTGLAMLKIDYKALPIFISSFWLIGSIGSLTMNFLISKGFTQKRSNKSLLTMASAFMLTAYIGMYSASHIYVFLAFFVFHTLGAPLFNNVMSDLLIGLTNKDNRGRVYGVIYSMQDLMILGALAVLNLNIEVPKIFLPVFVLIVGIRLIIATRFSPNKEAAHV